MVIYIHVTRKVKVGSSIEQIWLDTTCNKCIDQSHSSFVFMFENFLSWHYDLFTKVKRSFDRFAVVTLNECTCITEKVEKMDEHSYDNCYFNFFWSFKIRGTENKNWFTYFIKNFDVIKLYFKK